MALVRFPSAAHAADVVRSMVEAGVFSPEVRSVTIRVDSGGLPTAGAALLATWGRWARERGVLVTLDGDRQQVALLDRLGVMESLGRESPSGGVRSNGSLFVPVRFIADGTDVFEATNAILDLVVQEVSDARSFVPALEWAINETIDNIELHAEAPVPGAVCARLDPRTHVLDVGIVDVGRGLQASLSPVLEPWEQTAGQALKKAVQRGVTRDPAVGQGNGLAGARQITERNRGGFDLWTGDAVLRMENGQDRGFEVLPSAVPGTGASFRLDLRRPVDLADTFIGEPGWSYLEAAAEQAEDGLLVRQEVSNTGTRAPARRLRTKALNLLPDLEGPLVLDFEGVNRASSSFLDELIGRLADELGDDAFRERVRLVNLSPRLLDMANVVTTQRLGRTGPTN
ncbi:MAG: STAS-like domain-containing protein [Rhodothermales bacterium]